MYMIARTRSGKPTLQHRLQATDHTQTVCGLDATRWSRAYQVYAISAIFCKKCQRALEKDKG